MKFGFIPPILTNDPTKYFKTAPAANKTAIKIKSPKYEEIIELTDSVKITGRIPFIIEDERIFLYKLKIEGG